ncbi:MAG: hypothetical protein NTY65_06455 [Planctomycetota bacterium]|nr:hypothetical protein [Planctomycetota bacterium]
MKLGYAVLMVAVGAMLMLAPAAMAADKAEKGHDKNAAYGKVKAVGAESITIATKAGKDAAAEEKTIATNKDTKVVTGSRGEEKEGTMADVKEGASVRVTLTEDGKTAVKIAVMPPRGDRKGGHEKAPDKAPK